MTSASEHQEIFLRKMKGDAWLALLEHLPGVCFFLKDEEGRYTAANRAYAKYLGVAEPEDLIGKTDFDFHPEEVSQAYVSDDQKVMNSGESVIDFVEPWSTVDGRFGWTVTSKHPVYDDAGNAIGVVGVTQPSESENELTSEDSFGSHAEVTESSPANFQSEFLSQMKNQKGTRALFEDLPGVLFYIKNCERQFIAANRSLLNRLGLSSENEIVGNTDEDYFPPELAAGFENGDRQVIESGEPVFRLVEQYYNEQRLLDWHVATKLPIYDREGEIIGLMGVHRSSDNSTATTPVSGLAKATEFLRKNSDRRVTTEEMSAAAGMSVWQLRRRFRKAFGMTPHDFERSSRVKASCQALVDSDLSLAEIALSHGFCDQSAFSVQFRKQMGSTPKEYRNAQK